MLTDNLSSKAAMVVRRILAQLAGHSEPSPKEDGEESPRQEALRRPQGTAQGDTSPGDEGQSGITLPDLLNLVIAGARGDAQAGGQAYQITQALQQPGAPPQYAPLGKGLQRVLEGLRGQEATADLPEDVAEIIHQVLQAAALPQPGDESPG